MLKRGFVFVLPLISACSAYAADKLPTISPGLWRDVTDSYISFDQNGKPAKTRSSKTAFPPVVFCMSSKQSQEFFDPPGLKSCKLDVSLLKNGDVETKGICPDSGWTFHTINQVTPTKIFTDVWFNGNGTKTHKISHAVRIGDCPDKDLNADSATQTPPKLEPKL